VAAHPSAGELADEFGRAAKVLGERLTERLAGHGLSIARFTALVQLVRHGPLRLTRLGSLVGVSQGTASVLVESLVRDGLVERGQDPADGRATLLTITEEGRRRAEAWRADYERVTADLFAALPADQWSTLLSLLRTLSGARQPSD
jgi:DNA-binding MarR family transcriptional regulator